MPGLKTIKDFRDGRPIQTRQRFLALNPMPVLLMPNPATTAKPQDPGASGGYMTVAQISPTAPVGVSAKKTRLVVNDSFLVIPIVKGEGHPFPERVGVGRTKGTDIMLGARDVSKYHGYFSGVGDKWSFTDVGSSNGSFIKGERLGPMVATPLEDGVELGIGNGRYVFRTPTGFAELICSD